MLTSFLATTSVSLLMETSNTISSPTDWVQYYQRTLTGQAFGQSPSVSDATVVTTTITAPTTPLTSTSNSSLNPEGRVSKPARRRRASRAAPTTLVNTDTTNFRAMVQQFTGISNPITFGSQSDSQNIDFRMFQNQNASVVPQGHGYGYPLQRQYHQQQQQQQQQVLQQQGYMSQLQNRGDGLISSFSNARLNVEATDGFLGGNTSSSQMFPRSSSSSHNNGYIQ